MPTPPFQVTPGVMRALSRVDRALGRLEGVGGNRAQPMLRKRNRIRTIHGTVGIEGNALSVGQITAVLDGRRVVAASPRELREVQNAADVYAQADSLRLSSVTDLLAGHRTLMRGLVSDAGRFRTGNVGVMHGSRVAHVAPQAHLVAKLVRDLLRWAARAKEPRAIVAAVVHYELQFIHPFSDGNGRIGRLWQHVGLLDESKIFGLVPAESIIRERQSRYYAALRASDLAGHSTPFLEFSLNALGTALEEVADQVRPEKEANLDRLENARARLGDAWFSRAEYLSANPRLSTATASRDLADGVAKRVLLRRGDKRLTRYRFRQRSSQ